MEFDYSTNTLHIHFDEVEPLLRSFGEDVWSKFCKDIMEQFEKNLKEGEYPCKS